MNVKTKWVALGVVLGVAVALMLPSLAQTSSPAPGAMDRTVTVSGVGTIRSAPDEAVVTLGVRTQGATAEEAMAANSETMNRVIGAILSEGITQDDVATAWINLYPNYSETGTTIVGYTAENQVSVTIRDMGRIGKVIDRAVAAGANLTSGISFSVSDQNDGLDRALEQAVADARHKAEVMAGASGAQLGAVVQVAETGAPTPPPLYRDYAMAAEAGSVPPVEPPTIETQVSVTVVWELI
jgi:uncharacterized protein